MNKQIKYLTLQQIQDICNCYYPACIKNGVRCPLFDKTIGCDDIIATIRSALKHNPNALEEEVVLEPKEKTNQQKINNLGNELLEKEILIEIDKIKNKINELKWNMFKEKEIAKLISHMFNTTKVIFEERE